MTSHGRTAARSVAFVERSARRIPAVAALTADDLIRLAGSVPLARGW
ncbi:hypothetical protein AB0H83_40945 [Dactylosporangium sp. NPDC050688]